MNWETLEEEIKELTNENKIQYWIQEIVRLTLRRNKAFQERPSVQI